MKTRIPVVLALLLVVVFILYLLLNPAASPQIYVYGAAEGDYLIDDSELGSGFFRSLEADDVPEIMVLGEKCRVVLISSEFYRYFTLKKRERCWELRAEEYDYRMGGVKGIFLAEGRRDSGLYHLSGVEELGYYPFYELLRERTELSISSEIPLREGTIDLNQELISVETTADSLLIIYASGEEEWERISPYNWITLETDQLLPDLTGGEERRVVKAIWENPPQHYALEIHDLILESVRREPTLAIFVDGLGYSLWNYARENGFTESFPDIESEPMRVVYPPQTIYNYYAFGTGELFTPDVQERRELFTELADSNDIRGLIIEGEMQVYPSPLKQILHPRRRGEENIDHQIFQSSLKAIGKYDFLFVHFHDIDDYGHRYGPYSDQVLKAINRTGDYVNTLVNEWEGNVFVFSDHGMHQYLDRESGEYHGTHYTAGAEDIIGIFIRITGNEEGGMSEE